MFGKRKIIFHNKDIFNRFMLKSFAFLLFTISVFKLYRISYFNFFGLNEIRLTSRKHPRLLTFTSFSTGFVDPLVFVNIFQIIDFLSFDQGERDEALGFGVKLSM